MRISGLQKMTLLDYPGHVACTVFTPGCNLRCPFCHNAALVLPGRREEDIPEREVLTFLEKRRGLLEGVAVTGGEPLLQPGLPDFLRAVRDLGYSVKLDTNGTQPRRLRSLVEAGLVDRVAMDIKNAPALYGKTVGIEAPDLGPIEESKNYLLGNPVECEFRTTVVRGLHTAESLLAAARWIQGAREYYLQQFQNSGGLLAPEGLSAFSPEELRTILKSIQAIVPGARLRGVDTTTD